MSPDDELRWRLEAAERHAAALEKELDDVRREQSAFALALAVAQETIRNQAAEIVALWGESKWIRRLLVASMATVTTTAIGTAIVVFIKVGGGPA